MLAAELDARVPTADALAAYCESAARGVPGVVFDEDALYVDLVARLAAGGTLDDADARARCAQLDEECRQLDLVEEIADLLRGPVSSEETVRTALAAREELAQSRVTQAAAAIELIDERVVAPETEKRALELRALLAHVDFPVPGACVPDALRDACAQLFAVNPPVLFAILSEPLAKRVKFHFAPGKETCDAAKPEWLFRYVLSMIDPLVPAYRTLLETVADAPLPRIVRALFPTLVTIICTTYKLTAHTVQELLRFCSEVEARYLCSRRDTDELIGALFPAPLFARFLDTEQQAFMQSVDRAIASASHEPDFDVFAASAKPTFCALVVWQTVRQADYLLRIDAAQVLREIHAPVLDSYGDFLASRRFALADASRAWRHSSTESALDPHVAQLGALAGAASFVAHSLDALVLEHGTLQDARPALETVQARFLALRASTAALVAETLARAGRRALRAYTADADAARLRAALDLLRPEFRFIVELTSSSAADRARLLVPVSAEVAEFLWQNVLTARTFTPDAAQRLRADVGLVLEAWHLPLGIGMRRLLQGIDVVVGADADARSVGEPETDEVDSSHTRADLSLREDTAPESLLTSEEVAALRRRRV